MSPVDCLIHDHAAKPQSPVKPLLAGQFGLGTLFRLTAVVGAVSAAVGYFGTDWLSFILMYAGAALFVVWFAVLLVFPLALAVVFIGVVLWWVLGMAPWQQRHERPANT